MERKREKQRRKGERKWERTKESKRGCQRERKGQLERRGRGKRKKEQNKRIICNVCETKCEPQHPNKDTYYVEQKKQAHILLYGVNKTFVFTHLHCSLTHLVLFENIIFKWNERKIVIFLLLGPLFYLLNVCSVSLLERLPPAAAIIPSFFENMRISMPKRLRTPIESCRQQCLILPI